MNRKTYTDGEGNNYYCKFSIWFDKYVTFKSDEFLKGYYFNVLIESLRISFST